MDDDIRQAIEEIEFNPQKCEEIVNKIIDLMEENHVNCIERDYILIVLKKEFDMHDLLNR
jgi:hypothetical protein